MKGFILCPLCSTPCQRLLDENTTPEDGLMKHILMVHPGETVNP